jgi:iron complex outermembrane recepter protein
MMPNAWSPFFWLLCASPCIAQTVDADAPATTLPKITTTASRIPRIESETTSPTTVLRRADIERTGASSVKELIDTLMGSGPSNTGSGSSLSDISGGNSFAAGSSSAALRNLGSQATLVLLNSRRLAPFALDNDPGMLVNLDTLPLDAIDRVEVLRSGASALYGSDAVAGVINIITRRDYRGVQVRVAQDQSLNASQFRTRTASITAGFGSLADDGHNVLMNLELFKRTNVFWGQVLPKVNAKAAQFSDNFGQKSTYSYPGNLESQAIAGCPPEQVQNGLCYFDRYAGIQAQPAAERTNFLISAERQFDSGLKGFAELLHSSTETRYLSVAPFYGTSIISTWFDPSTGQPRFFTERGLPKEHPLNPTGQDAADFRYRFIDANTRTTVTSNNYRALVGLRGTHRDKEWEAAVGTMGGTVLNRSSGYFSDSAFKQLIGDYTLPNDPQFFNRGYALNQPNSADTIRTLFPEFSSRGKNSQTFLDGKISGPLTQWQGRSVDMAVGFDLRHERLSITPSENLFRGDIVGQGLAQTQGQRTHGSVFGELNIPLAEKLEMQAAARIDKYPQFAANLSPKLGLRFEPTPKWLLRGTVESGFRAPNLSENSTSTRYGFTPSVQDPKRCPQALALAETLRSTAQTLPDTDPLKAQNLARADLVETQECGLGVASVTSSNPHLQPEKSMALTLGAAFQPAAGYFVSLDYWAIRRRNEIGYKSIQDILSNENNLTPGIINRFPAGKDPSFTPEERQTLQVQAEPLAWTSGQIENTARTFTSGIDLAAHTRTVTPLGAITTGLQATYLLNYFNFSPLLGGYGDNLAGRYNYPRFKSALTASLAKGPFTNTLQLNYTRGTQLQGDFFDTVFSQQGCLERDWALSDCRIRSYTTLDYTFAYTRARRLTFQFQVRNLLNQRSPFDVRALFENGGGSIPQDLRDVQRRSLKLSLEYKFL